MTFTSAEAALTVLRERAATATLAQLEIAEASTMQLDANVPSIVAAAKLRCHLSGPLQLETRTTLSESEAELINELAEGAGVTVPDSATADELVAWLDYLRLVGRIEHLERDRPGTGTLVLDPDGEPAIVSSIDSDGRLWFMGGMGRRAWPDQCSVVPETDGNHREIFEAAENRAAERRPLHFGATAERDLLDFKVRRAPEQSRWSCLLKPLSVSVAAGAAVTQA